MKNILILFILFSSALFAQNESQFPNITLTNSIEYKDTSFTNNHPGCGFLIDVGDEILAVTCKHVLWENKPLNISTVDVNDQIVNWKMFIRNDKSQYVILDKLINNNPNEKIGEWNTDKDFLVFTIKENHSNIKPLKLAAKRAQKGDTLYKVGWAFKDKDVPQQIYRSSVFKYLDQVILIQDFERSNQAGTSGSPVINKNLELHGIVSSWKYDNESGSWYGAPCSTDYLWEVLYSYWINKNNELKNIESFNKFISNYESNTGSKPEITTNIVTNIFFNDWLNKQNIEISSRKDFNKFKSECENKLGANLENDPSILNKIQFNEWKIDFLKDNKTVESIDEISSNSDFYYDFMMLSVFALELIDIKEIDKAFEIMNFTVSKFPNFGQVYAFLADVYIAKHDKENAKLNYEKCLKFYPGYPYAKDKLRSL